MTGAGRLKNFIKVMADFLYPPGNLDLDKYGRLDMLKNDEYFGRMNDPTSSGAITGPCGDSMEFYLVIRNNIIEEIKYYTDGCENTRTCGSAVARRADGRTIIDALGINPAEIITSNDCLSEEGRHCAILAVSTLYRAVADYLLKP